MYIVLLKGAGEHDETTSDDPYAQALTKAGFTVKLIGTLDFEYHVEALSSLKSWQDTHSCIIFTSPRAVNAFVKAGLSGKTSDLCFVVGNGTAKSAQKANFSPVGAETGDAEKLSELIVSNYKSKLTKPALFVAGQLHRDTLPRFLSKHDIKLNTVIAYSSRENEQFQERLRLTLCEGNPVPDFIVYFSPSGVSATESILKTEVAPHRPKIQLVAMGRATASRLEEIGISVSAVSPSPKPEGLLGAIKAIIPK